MRSQYDGLEHTTVTVETDRARVTVTGVAQSAAPAAEFPPDPDSPLLAPVGAAETVTYRVEVDVPLMVVVCSSLSPPTFPAPPAGRVAYMVAVDVCLMVVVTTVL